MAIVNGFLQMTGSIKGMSFYTPVGSDKVIMRTKGGATKYTIQNGDNFARLRLHQIEWQGCVKFGQSMKDGIGDTYRLADFNLTPVWNGMGRKILKLDTVSPVGQRFLRFSQCKQVMEGYNLNKKYPITTILRVSPLAELNRETLSATVSLPLINASTDVQNIQRLPYFRLIICLGLVSDMKYTEDDLIYKYVPVNNEWNGISKSILSDWHVTSDVLQAHVLSVQFRDDKLPPLTDDVTVLLSMGIEFGNVGIGGEIMPVKRAGCGKILLCR
jgi:hypothetical protein